MTTDELIGSVVASYLRDHISGEDSVGVARYLLDCLTADQTAAIAKTILADAKPLKSHRDQASSSFRRQLRFARRGVDERAHYLLPQRRLRKERLARRQYWRR